MRFLRRALTGVFLLSLTLVVLGYAGSLVYGAVTDRMNAEPRGFPQRESVVAVNVVTVEPETVIPELSVFGEIRARQSIDLRSPVGGTVVHVAPSLVEGGRVTAGEVLLRVDPTEAEADLARAEAALDEAMAARRDAERDLALAREELLAAERQAELRAAALQRQLDLQSRGVGTAPDIEAAELADSAARQTILSRKQAVAQAEAQIDQSQSRIALARIDLAEAERTLAGTEIVAAFDGVATEVAVGAGGRVTANERIATLIDPAALEAAFRVSTAQYAQLLGEDGRLERLEVEVAIEAAGVTLAAAGRIERESATVSEGLAGRLIFAELGPAPGFRAGDFVAVTVREEPIDNLARLPASAVGADGIILVLGPEDRLEAAAVEVVRRQGDDVLVRAPGLEGRQAVAARTPLLGEGIKVRPIVTGPDGQAAAAPEPAPEMIALDPERRARLVALVEGNARMPAEAKSRILSQLEAETVPADMVARLEARAGG